MDDRTVAADQDIVYYDDMDDRTVAADPDGGYYDEVDDQTADADAYNELDELYRQLGKAYYEGAFEDPLPQLLPFFDQITKIKGSFCPRCHAKLQQNAFFCSKCGKKIR